MSQTHFIKLLQFLNLLAITLPMDQRWLSQNPRIVLDVASDATESNIKTSYRRLSMKYHPDRNKGDAEAEEIFKKIKAAYETLTDTKPATTNKSTEYKGVHPNVPASIVEMYNEVGGLYNAFVNKYKGTSLHLSEARKKYRENYGGISNTFKRCAVSSAERMEAERNISGFASLKTILEVQVYSSYLDAIKEVMAQGNINVDLSTTYLNNMRRLLRQDIKKFDDSITLISGERPSP